MTMEYARTMLIDNEWDRWDRQNLVLLGIRDKLLDPSIWLKVPGIILQFDELITTDLSPEQIVDLTCMIDEVPQEDITLLEIGPDMVQGGDDGGEIMYPDVEKIIEFLDGIFGNND
jgi:anionic cell wall polymer biosynthesis LytR-Cps2A-Psr (LCP) family protein